MSRLFLILLLVYVVSATRCIVKDDKDESDVVTLQIPDTRRKRETHEICKKDSDCTKGDVCVPYLGCMKGHRKDRASNNFTQM
ncbi:uncharacterized protein LOC100863613 isoform X2 [Apis florea]|uniref:uncharacterized protein LOC100863613 isoform X2 n=1 Tax=Apis florea TaxID=7463 RepID=UPI0012FEBAA7|nr:uncharacterized protein LOC100863613 isoform X2 [Apis florea]